MISTVAYRSFLHLLIFKRRRQATEGLLVTSDHHLLTSKHWLQSSCVVCIYLAGADRVRTGAGWWSQETEAGLQAGAGGGLDDYGELRTALPRAHWEETPSETELCLSEDLSPCFSIMWLPPSAFQRWLLPWPFFCFLLPKNILSFSSALLHKLVYLKKIRRVVLDWGHCSPQCNVGDSSSLPQGVLRGVNAWKVAILAYFGPPAGRRERKSILCCLQEFTLVNL